VPGLPCAVAAVLGVQVTLLLAMQASHIQLPPSEHSIVAV
jgi:hypothetical protein